MIGHVGGLGTRALDTEHQREPGIGRRQPAAGAEPVARLGRECPRRLELSAGTYYRRQVARIMRAPQPAGSPG